MHIHCRLKKKRGFTLLDAMIGFMVMAFLSLGFVTVTTVLRKSQHMSDDASKAVQIAQRQIEQLRLVGFDNLTYAGLQSLDLLDDWDGEGPFTFSKISIEQATQFSPSAALHDGVGELYIDDIDDNSKKITVIVHWKNKVGEKQSVELETIIGRY